MWITLKLDVNKKLIVCFTQHRITQEGKSKRVGAVIPGFSGEPSLLKFSDTWRKNGNRTLDFSISLQQEERSGKPKILVTSKEV